MWLFVVNLMSLSLVDQSPSKWLSTSSAGVAQLLRHNFHAGKTTLFFVFFSFCLALVWKHSNVHGLVVYICVYIYIYRVSAFLFFFVVGASLVVVVSFKRTST